MLDYVIRNGLVVDGTGVPGRRADVGVQDGKIVAVGEVGDEGATEFDAEGLVVAPGIIDPRSPAFHGALLRSTRWAPMLDSTNPNA